jgi:vacuolar-type H+-ATPase subunit H
MAGEGIGSIKKTEEEAARIVVDAQAETKKILQKARDRKKELINSKDKALVKEEENIKSKYSDQTKEVLTKLEGEEVKNVEKVNEHCQKNLNKVVSFISKQIVKE